MPDRSELRAVEPTEPSEGQQRTAAVRAAANRAGARTVRVQQGSRQSTFNEDPAAVYGSVFGSLYQQYASLAYWLPFEVLDYVEVLSTYNPDFSQAVDNIRTLANSGHELFVDCDNADLATEIKDRLEAKAREIQARNGGIDGLIDKLLDQAAVFGSMCGEWVLSDALDDVVDFAEVNPKNIRFFWDETTNKWMPFQKVSLFQAQQAERNGQQVKNTNFVQLNPVTFFYYAFDSAPANPYGTPPFVAALQNIAIQRDMLTNLAQIVKKVGLLGIIDFVVKALPMEPGESDDMYSARANAYLDTYVSAIENMVRDGGIVHFDDSEANSYQITGNAAGATAIFKQNEELIFSGLKSMPSVQGRSYSTTETYAGVAYDIIIRNTQKYQRSCKRMVEAGYWLMVQAWGYDLSKIKGITINFNSNKTLHRLQDAQAELLEIRNSLQLWAAGIINQQDMAQRHGEDRPKTEFEEPPESALLGNGSPGGGAGNTSIATNDKPGQNGGTAGGKAVKMPESLRQALLAMGKAAGDAATPEDRREAGVKLAEETLALQQAYFDAGMPHVIALQEEFIKALGL